MTRPFHLNLAPNEAAMVGDGGRRVEKMRFLTLEQAKAEARRK